MITRVYDGRRDRPGWRASRYDPQNISSKSTGFGGKVLRQVQMSAIPRAGLQFRGRGVMSHGGNG